jgi:hypothetical protein
MVAEGFPDLIVYAVGLDAASAVRHQYPGIGRNLFCEGGNLSFTENNPDGIEILKVVHGSGKWFLLKQY